MTMKTEETAMTDEQWDALDIWEQGGALWRVLYRVIADDDDGPKELMRFVDEYEGWDPLIQGVVNAAFVAICGWSIPRLMEMAKGRSVDEAEAMAKPTPWVIPSDVTATLRPGAEEYYSEMQQRHLIAPMRPQPTETP